MLNQSKMKLRNHKIIDMTGPNTNESCLGSPLGRVLEVETSLKVDGSSIGDIYTNQPHKTPRNIRKIINTSLDLKDIYPEDIDIPNSNSKLCIADIGNFVSPVRTSKHKKYNLKNF